MKLRIILIKNKNKIMKSIIIIHLNKPKQMMKKAIYNNENNSLLATQAIAPTACSPAYPDIPTLPPHSHHSSAHCPCHTPPRVVVVPHHHHYSFGGGTPPPPQIPCPGILPLPLHLLELFNLACE
jgi:hypothetical protein